MKEIGIPIFTTTAESVFHHYISLSENRGKSRSLLNEQGIATEIHYPESAEDSYHKITNTKSKGTSVKAKELSQKIMSLPISPWIKESEIEYIIGQISLESIRRSFLGET